MPGGVILDQYGSIVTRATLDGNDVMFIQDSQECADVLESCKQERATDVLRGFRKTGYMGQRCLAEFPLVLVDALKAQGMDIINDRDALRKVLNDPEFAGFRCSTGKI